MPFSTIASGLSTSMNKEEYNKKNPTTLALQKICCSVLSIPKRHSDNRSKVPACQELLSNKNPQSFSKSKDKTTKAFS
jgi:hypothetical protein